MRTRLSKIQIRLFYKQLLHIRQDALIRFKIRIYIV